MKKLNYILLFLFLSFFGKSFVVQRNYKSAAPNVLTKTSLEKKKQASYIVTHSIARVKKKYRPKKPKGIQVIIPNVSTLVFKKVFYRSGAVVHEVKGTYSLVLHYSHGKRGPPSEFV